MSKQNFSHTIWMGDLDMYMTEDFIKQAFASTGETVVSVKVIRSKTTLQPLGYCFVEFPNIEDGRNAMLKLNGKEIPGSSPPRRFKLNHASYGKEHLNVQEFSMFVGELSEDVDDLALYNAFKRYPSCRSAKVVLDNGKSRGYGFVRFTEEQDHKRAMSEMQNYSHLGRKPIRVSLAAPKRPTGVSTGGTTASAGDAGFYAGSGPAAPPASMDVPPLPTDPAYAYYQQAYASYLPQYGPYYAHQWACYYAHTYSGQCQVQQQQQQQQQPFPANPSTPLLPPPPPPQPLMPPMVAAGSNSESSAAAAAAYNQQFHGYSAPLPDQHHQHHQEQQQQHQTQEELEAAYLSEPVDPEAAAAADVEAALRDGEAAYFELECSRWSIFDPNLPRIVNAV